MNWKRMFRTKPEPPPPDDQEKWVSPNPDPKPKLPNNYPWRRLGWAILGAAFLWNDHNPLFVLAWFALLCFLWADWNYLTYPRLMRRYQREMIDWHIASMLHEIDVGRCGRIKRGESGDLDRIERSLLRNIAELRAVKMFLLFADRNDVPFDELFSLRPIATLDEINRLNENDRRRATEGPKYWEKDWKSAADDANKPADGE
jgi:hypothetical protein